MYILYMILGVIGFLALLVFIARVIWMNETHPDKKHKPSDPDSHKCLTERINH